MTPSNSTQSLLIFRIGGIHCAVRLESLQEIVPMARLSIPPGLPHILQGFLNLGGGAVPVLRLDRLFGFPEQTLDLYTPLVILNVRGNPVALLVEEVLEVAALPKTALLPVDPNHSFNGCAEATVEFRGIPAHLLDIGRLLLEKERRCVADFQRVEQGRLQKLSNAATVEAAR